MIGSGQKYLRGRLQVRRIARHLYRERLARSHEVDTGHEHPLKPSIYTETTSMSTTTNQLIDAIDTGAGVYETVDWAKIDAYRSVPPLQPRRRT